MLRHWKVEVRDKQQTMQKQSNDFTEKISNLMAKLLGSHAAPDRMQTSDAKTMHLIMI